MPGEGAYACLAKSSFLIVNVLLGAYNKEKVLCSIEAFSVHFETSRSVVDSSSTESYLWIVVLSDGAALHVAAAQRGNMLETGNSE